MSAHVRARGRAISLLVPINNPQNDVLNDFPSIFVSTGRQIWGGVTRFVTNFLMCFVHLQLHVLLISNLLVIPERVMHEMNRSFVIWDIAPLTIPFLAPSG